MPSRSAVAFSLAALLALAGCGPRAARETPLPPGPQQDLRAGSLQVSVLISTEQSRLLVGEYILLRVRFINAGAAADFFNPVLDPAVLPSAELALYNAQGHFVGNFLPARADQTAGPEAWVHVPAGGVAERQISVGTDTFPGNAKWQLKPGAYTLQLVYTPALLMPRPDSADRGLAPAPPARAGVMRSNVVPIYLSPLVPK